MDLTSEQEAEIARIKGQMRCPKSFACEASAFERLCRARPYGVDDIVCREEEYSSSCPFRFHFGSSGVFCRCPLRKYIALRLGR
jgi:hypothetical protein